ncbi:hypothetical protein MED222_06375 [Vibrio sp. MED222]|nr:hypothetical protein MED222_06375 [Vibrio sp. MED222]
MTSQQTIALVGHPQYSLCQHRQPIRFHALGNLRTVLARHNRNHHRSA